MQSWDCYVSLFLHRVESIERMFKSIHSKGEKEVYNNNNNGSYLMTVTVCRHFCVYFTCITLGSISSIAQSHDRGAVIISVVEITVSHTGELSPQRDSGGCLGYQLCDW